MGSIPTPGTITRRWLVPVPGVRLRRSAVAQSARPSGTIPTPGTINVRTGLGVGSFGMLHDIRRMMLSPTGVMAFVIGAGGGLFVMLSRAMAFQAVTLFLSIYAWAATSLVLGGDPMVAHGGVVVTVAAMISGALVSTMSVVAAILRWSRSDDIMLRLLWRDVAAALVGYGTLCIFPAGDIV